uniref:PX domain-containing protein n=1 Tax=Branchiostoma floridae TaxID=7739 RepID=C3Y6D2_BRAFL|eukprot:XP_002607882.1 hypothetical protein BRAFLDRAFT_213611 [Branchiostoma floridae]
MTELGNQRSKRVITGVSLLGIEKRYVPNKHYLYILSVKWSEGSEFIIYRRYSAFFQLHQKLSELFPIETGAVSRKDQTIPPLPSKRRHYKFKVADERMLTIDGYCRKVAIAEPKISEHEEVLSFFETLPEDLTPPPPDPVTQKKFGTNFAFIMKSKCEEFLTTEQYEAQIDDEISFDKGVIVHVIHKLLDGWWIVR